MQIGIGISLTGGGRVPFNPLTLFTGGQLGAWYDPSDLSSMFQDSAGTTPAAVDSPVGKINDKSGRGYHLTQGTAAARPVLRQVGALRYLELDGVDDALTMTAGTGLDLFKNVGAASLFAAGFASAVTGFPTLFAWLTNSGGLVRTGLLRNTTHLVAGGRRLDGDAFDSAEEVSTITANVAFVQSGLFDYTGAVCTLRKNGVQVAQKTGFQGAGGNTANTSSSSAGISTGAYPGGFYGGIALQRLPDAATLADIETYLRAKAGV